MAYGTGTALEGQVNAPHGGVALAITLRPFATSRRRSVMHQKTHWCVGLAAVALALWRLWSRRGDWRGGGALPATLRCLLHRRYDVALCLGTPALGWLAVACGIPRQEFMDFPTLWWLSRHGQAAWNRRHAVDLYATAGRRLDVPPVEHRLTATVMPSERGALRAMLRRLHADDGSPRVVIHAGCSSAVNKKRWPSRRFAEVAATLVALRLVAGFLAPGQPAYGTYAWPVQGPVIRDFEPPPNPYASGHRGIDIAVPYGTLIVAPLDGTVAFAGTGASWAIGTE